MGSHVTDGARWPASACCEMLAASNSTWLFASTELLIHRKRILQSAMSRPVLKRLRLRVSENRREAPVAGHKLMEPCVLPPVDEDVQQLWDLLGCDTNGGPGHGLARLTR